MKKERNISSMHSLGCEGQSYCRSFDRYQPFAIIAVQMTRHKAGMAQHRRERTSHRIMYVNQYEVGSSTEEFGDLFPSQPQLSVRRSKGVELCLPCKICAPMGREQLIMCIGLVLAFEKNYVVGFFWPIVVVLKSGSIDD